MSGCRGFCPTRPTRPTCPTRPTRPTRPTCPTRPTRPTCPTRPTRPTRLGVFTLPTPELRGRGQVENVAQPGRLILHHRITEE